MRQKQLQLSSILLLSLGLTNLHAQESVNATGGNAVGGGGTASYTIGQVVYTTNTSTRGLVAQGVQQAFEISAITGIEQTAINLSIAVYPTPTTDFLTLQVDALATLNIEVMSYQLLDMNGKLLEMQKVISNETNIRLSNFASGTYFIKVLLENIEIKTFKIIKN